ncbi:MAG: hypothetical protein ACE15D_12285 [Candidatus Eisenbacteria bacterium]
MPSKTVLFVGFLTSVVGFLTVGAASAAPLDEALVRLDRLESEQHRLVLRADSLGELLAALSGDPSKQKPLLREAERLGAQARRIDVEVLLERQRCRSLATRELEQVQERRSDADLAREAHLLDLLDRRLQDPWEGRLVLVQPDSADGYETLLDKQAYLSDLRDRIETLEQQLRRRGEAIRREESLRRASEGFAEESRFLDEGGRVGSDETARTHGLSGVPDGDGAARGLGVGGSVLPSADPDELGPPDAATSRDAAALVRQAVEQMQQDLGRVRSALEATEQLLRNFSATSAPRR